MAARRTRGILLFADAELHGKSGAIGPPGSFAVFDVEGLCTTFYPQTPVGGGRRGATEGQRLCRRLFEVPALAAIGRFVELVAIAIGAEAPIDDEAAAVLGREEELLDHPEAVVGGIAENRTEAPGL